MLDPCPMQYPALTTTETFGLRWYGLAESWPETVVSQR